MLKEVYGDNCLAKSRVLKWHKAFREGRESVENLKRTPKPRIRSAEMIQKVKEFIAGDQNVTTKRIAEAFGISNKTVYIILTKDLGIKKGLFPIYSTLF